MADDSLLVTMKAGNVVWIQRSVSYEKIEWLKQSTDEPLIKVVLVHRADISH